MTPSPRPNPSAPQADLAERGMRLRKIRSELHSSFRGFLRLGEAFGDGHPGSPGLATVAARQPRPSKRIFRIDLQSPPVIVDRPRRVFLREPILEEPAL